MTDYLNEACNYLELAQEYDRKVGINDLSKIGIVRELMMSNILGHYLIEGKHIHDAEDEEGNKIEYLSKKDNNNSYCFDCMFSRPQEFKDKSLERITRNDRIYCASFSGIICTEIYCVDDVNVIKDFVDQNLTKRDKNGQSKNNEHTVSIPNKIIKEYGRLVYDRNGRD